MIIAGQPPRAAAFLGVERSFGGRRWQARPCDERVALALAQRHGLPELVGRVLAARGVGLDEAPLFLGPTLRAQLPDPSSLKDMDVAVDRLVRAVTRGEPIAVFGDYDVDGATSAALLVRFFRAVGVAVAAYIPDRVSEGYGPNLPALLRLHAAGVRVVVTVDCGTTAFEPLAGAAAAGLDVVVIDHHEGEACRPAAVAVVNPNRLDETSPHRHLAAVGVTFLLVVALNRGLRAAGWYRGRTEPDLLQWLDLVALGTVCDVVPLVGINRALVAQGIKVMARRANAGLAALADTAGLRERPDAYHLGYVLGPRVNAGGRVGEAGLGTRLLAGDDPVEAAEMARRLEAYNRERQEKEAVVLAEALAQVEAATADAPLVLATGTGWHQGVIGIIAGRLKERYHRPACVVTFDDDDDGEGKGSGRSVPGFDLGAAVIAARQQGLLGKGGGHAMAAGFSLRRDQLDAFRAFLAERLAQAVAHAGGDGGPLVPRLALDGALAVGGVTPRLVEGLAEVGPFGAGNAEPCFAVTARVARAEVVGSGHVRCLLAGAEGGIRLKAIAFRAAESDLGRALLGSAGLPLHLAGRLRLDRWQGQASVQLFLDDAAPAHAGAAVDAAGNVGVDLASAPG